MSASRAALLAAALLATLPASALRPDRQARLDARRFGLDRLERRVRRAPTQAVRRAFRDFDVAHGGAWRLRFSPRTGAVESVAGGQTGPSAGSPSAVARRFLSEQRALLGIDPDSLQIETESRGWGHRHVLYRQLYRGLPVEFSRVKLHLGPDGSVIGCDSRYEPDLTLPVTPTVPASAAAVRAATDAGGAAYGDPELVVLPLESTGRAHLAWKIKARGPAASWRYYVDALTGQVLLRYNGLRFATAGTITSDVYAVDPNGGLVNRPIANQYVFIGDATTRVTSAVDGTYSSPTDGKVSMSLQGPFVSVSNFRGPSAHYDNGSGVWLTAATPLSSPRPYPNSAVLVSTLTLPVSAPQFANAVKILPVFTNFNVGIFFGGSADSSGDIIDDDEVGITDGNSMPVASYVGARGAFNGAAVAGKTLHLALKSNAAGQADGYDVSVSSYLALTAPAVPAAGASHNWVPADGPTGLRSEINLFYHLNLMHDYFANGPNQGGFAPIVRPVVAMAHVGPNLVNAFYNPEYDNLMFGDVSAAAPLDLFSEDATVPHHEYTHYLIEKIWSIQNFGQAGAISEALADYFAASSLNVSSIGKYANGGDPLRELNCNLAPSPPCPGAVLGPTTWVGEIHDDSLFLSQALWQLRGTLMASALGAVNGQACADGLAFQALLFFPEGFMEYHDAMRRLAGNVNVAACAGLAAGVVQSNVDTAFANHGLSSTAGDVWETARRNDGFETAVDVSTLGAVSATILPSGDQDFWTFSAGPGLVTVRLSLPPSGGYFKAYQLKLYDRSRRLVAAAAPPYNGFFTVNNACESVDCTTTAGEVRLDYNNPSGGQLYLQVTGGDTLDGSSSGVQSAVPYSVSFQFPVVGALASSIVTAQFDSDVISFAVNVATFVSTQDWRFSSAQLRDQALSVLPNTRVVVPAQAGDLLTLVSSSNALGTISGSARLVVGFAERFPAVGTVHVEVFGYNVSGSTASMGVSNPLNLSGDKTELKAYNNAFNPARGEKSTVKYTIAAAGRVTIKLYTVTGGYIATLLDADMPAGKGSVDWYGRNLNGSVVASGIYLVRIDAPGIQKTQKIAIIK